ncbi:MAG TPA: NBR1-Ig-like domain-containing protein [Anaerolineales bacterium]|jgi:hypothetical protein
MNRTAVRPIGVAWIVLVTLAWACNLPSGTPGIGDAASTAAAQTVQAQLTQDAVLTPTTPTITSTAPPTGTSIIPPTTAVVISPTSNCDVSQFITDVTIPDGTILTPGQAFTKTWRIKNVGTCSWTPSYAVVFSSGNAMGGPATQALTGNVNPGQTVDISVNLTAPGTAGDYTGYWKLRNASGVLFAQFYVQIKVQALPPAIASVVLTNLTGEDGFVRTDGTLNGNPNVGDLDDNQTAEAFVSFDMTGIPSGATITKVVVDFSDYDTLGNPWSISDGYLRAYVHNYGALDAGDYFVGDPLGAVIAWNGASALNSSFEDADMITVVQNRVGTSRVQLRLQFRTPTTNSNGVADMIRFGAIKLTVTYQ